MKRIFLSILIAVFISAAGAAGNPVQDKLLDLLETELKREMNELSDQENPPYYISYRVNEIKQYSIGTSFGDLLNSNENFERILEVSVRVGDKDLDNSHELRDNFSQLLDFQFGTELPVEDNPDAIKQVLWQQTLEAYRKAADKYAKVKANVKVKVEEEDQSADFTEEESSVYIEPRLSDKEMAFDAAKWENALKEYSKSFLELNDVFAGFAGIRFTVERKYFVSSEGTKIAQNSTYTRLSINARIKSDDGMVLPLYKTWFAYKPEDLPDAAVVKKEIEDMKAKLIALKDAPVVEPYTGPAILSSGSAGVFFHEIFGHRIEGERQKKVTDGQTFKKKIGQSVLPETMNIIMDPTIRTYADQDLIGYYVYDDEGIKGQKVDVVKNGILNDFLMSRCPIEGFSKSNGHGRAQAGQDPVTRQSNLIVETTDPKTDDELRKMLIDEAKAQGKDYGYLFKQVTGGFTITGRFIPNSFNVMPTEVYRIYVDGRPDELVRGVDLVGTPLAMFSQIEAAGNKPAIFTGMCGAESGSVPVTAISPSLFVKQIEMQKKSKNQDKPPLLPRPGAKPDKD